MTPTDRDTPTPPNNSPTDRPLVLSTRADLEAVLADHERVLLEFHTEGCSQCAAMEPVLDGVARTTDLVVATMNPRDDPELIDRYDVRSVPKLLVFVDGGLVATREDGFLGVDDVRAFVADATGEADGATARDAGV